MGNQSLSVKIYEITMLNSYWELEFYTQISNVC
jgi:hypothetical protein